MKQMFKNISIFALSVCCGVFYSVDSQSKVCFLGDEDCTDNVSFDFNFIDVEEECKKEGYTIKAENCKTPYEYCPHSNMWVKCCNEQEYYYDSCDHNTTEKGRCGYGNNYKYKCECDESIYAFESCDTDTEGPKRSVDTRYSCTKKDYSGNTTTLYAKCSCDGSYKYKAEDCEAFENSEPQNACSHDYSDGFPWGKDTTTYYAQCGCNRNIYQKDVDTCDLGAFGKICKDTLGKTYAENCKSCDGYHDVGELDFVGTSKTQCGFSNGETADGSGYDTTNCTYVICPHDSSKQKIIRCDGENFKSTPADNGKKCVCEDDYELIDNKCVAKMTCNDAVKAFLENVKRPGSTHGYPVLTSEGVVDFNHETGTYVESTAGPDTPVIVFDLADGSSDLYAGGLYVALGQGEPTTIEFACTKMVASQSDAATCISDEKKLITPKGISTCGTSVVTRAACKKWVAYATAGTTPMGKYKNFYSPNYAGGYYQSFMDNEDQRSYLRNMKAACEGNAQISVGVNSEVKTQRYRKDEAVNCQLPATWISTNCVNSRITPLAIGTNEYTLWDVNLVISDVDTLVSNEIILMGSSEFYYSRGGTAYSINSGSIRKNGAELLNNSICGYTNLYTMSGDCPIIKP